MVSAPVSIRLDDEVRQTLEAEAQERGLGLSTFLREIVRAEARRLRNRRIREESRRVGEYVASSPEARQFYEDWGKPDWEGL